VLALTLAVSAAGSELSFADEIMFADPGHTSSRAPLRYLSPLSRVAYTRWAAAHGRAVPQTALQAGGFAARTLDEEPPTVPAPGVPANVRVNDPAGDAPGETQSSTSAAANGRFLIAVYTDSKGLNGFPTTFTGYSYSTDGGASWTDGGSLPVTGGQLYGEPSIVADSLGNFVVASLYYPDSPSFGTSAIGISRGRFVGNVPQFDPPVTAVSSIADFLTKPFLALDPTTGRLYLAYIRYVNGEGTGQVDCVRSTTGGLSWDPPVVVQSDAVDFVVGPYPVVGTNGELYVFFENHYGFSTLNATLRYAISTDGGQSFGPRFDAATIHENWYSGPPGYNRLDGFFEFPTAAVDRSTGPYRGNVYVAWNESTIPRVGRVGTSVPETEPNNSPAQAEAITLPQVVTGSVTVRADSDYYKITTTTSGQMVRVIASPGTSQALHLKITAGPNGDSLLVDSYYPPSIYGLSYPAPAWITLPSAGTYYIEVGVDSIEGISGSYTLDVRAITRTVGAPALDHRDIVLIRSTNHGTSWSTPVRVNDDGALYDQSFPMLDVDSLGVLHAFWYDRRDGAPTGVRAATYAARSTNGGVSFSPNIAVSEGAFAWQGPSRLVPNMGLYSSATFTGRTSLPLWADLRGGSPDVYTVPIGDGVLSSCPSDTTVQPGGSVVLSYMIRNLSPFTDTLTYTLADSLGWMSSGGATVVLAPAATTTVQRTVSVPGTLCNGARDRATLTYYASGSRTFVSTCTTRITAADVNCPPVVAMIPNQTVAENATLTVTPSASDPDGDTLSWSGTNLPAGAVVNAQTGVLTWTPTFTQAGTYAGVTLTANDGHGGSASRSFTITVTNTPRDIVEAVPDSGSLLSATHPCATVPITIVRETNTPMRGFSVTCELSPGLRLCNGTASIREGTYLSSIGLTAFEVVNEEDSIYTTDNVILGSPCGATAATGTLYSLDVTNTAPHAGGTIVITAVTLRDCDNVPILGAPGDTAFISFTNTPPVVSSIPQQTVMEGDTLRVVPSATDADGDTLAWSGTNLPAGATVDPATGVLLWVPTSMQVGTYPGVTLTASDAYGGSGGASFTIVVTPFPRDTVAVSPDTSIAHHACAMVSMTIAHTTAAAIRDFSVTFALSPQLVLCNGIASITEGTYLSDAGTTTFQVVDNGDGTYTADGAIAGMPCGATAANGVLFRAGATNAAPHTGGTIAVRSVILHDCDGQTVLSTTGDSAVINVLNSPPNVSSISDQTVQERDTLIVTPGATDADGDTLTWSGSNLPSGATVNAMTGVLTWTPAPGQAGTYTGVTLTAADGHGGVTSVTFTITVTQGVTAVAPGGTILPARLSLARVEPNPFASRLTVVVASPKETRVQLSVWNANGQRVTMLSTERVAAGYTTIVWDGRDARGRKLPGGVYVLRVDANGAHAEARILKVH
jgi:hypothetical protein